MSKGCTMFIQRFQYIFLAIFAVLVLSSCSSGGDDDTGSSRGPVESSGIEGTLLDAPISGVTYNCDGIDYVTDSEGKFECQSFPIVFSVGPIEIGKITALGVDLFVLPQDLLQIARNNLSDEDLLALVVLLQSLDSDNDLSNGIQISQTDIDKMIQNNNSSRTIKDMGYTGVMTTLHELNITAIGVDEAMFNLKTEMKQRLEKCNIIADEELTTQVNHSTSSGVYFDTIEQSLLSVSQGSNGSSEIFSVANEFVNINYTPNKNFVGVDDFTYTVDGCTKKVHVIVSGGTASDEFVVFAFKDAIHGVNPWSTDGTPDGTKRINSNYDMSRLYMGKFMPKVNGNFVYGIHDEKFKIYGSNKEGTHYINWIDNNGQTHRPLHIDDDDKSLGYIVHQEYGTISTSGYEQLRAKVFTFNNMDYLYYVATSPAALNDEENGAASGTLAWKTTGRAPYSFGQTANPGEGIVLYAKDRWCRFSFVELMDMSGLCYNTLLVEDIVGDGIGLDEVVSNFVQIDSYVYYVGHYKSNEIWWLFRDDLTQSESPPERIKIYEGSKLDPEVQLATLGNKIYIFMDSYEQEYSKLLVGDVTTFYTKMKDMHNKSYYIKNSGELLHQIDSNGTYNIGNPYLEYGFSAMADKLYFWTSSSSTGNGYLYEISLNGTVRKIDMVDELHIQRSKVVGNKLFYSTGYDLMVFDRSGVIPADTKLLSSTHHVDQLEEIHGKIYTILDRSILREFDPKLGTALVGSGGRVIEDGSDNCRVILNSEQLNESTVLYIKHCAENASVHLYNQISKETILLKLESW